MHPEHSILGPITFHDHRAGSSTDVEEERRVDVGQVDEVRDHVAAADEDGVDRRIVCHEASRELHGCDSCGTPGVDVDAPGVLCPNLMCKVDGGGPQQTLSPFFGGAEHDVDIERIDARLLDGFAGGVGRHLVRMHGGVGDKLALDREFLSDCSFRKAALLGDVLAVMYVSGKYVAVETMPMSIMCDPLVRSV